MNTGPSIQIFCAVLLAACAVNAHAQKPIQSLVEKTAAADSRPGAEDRQRKMLADADRLLTLAQSLKNAVDKARRDELSVQVVRQAAEIEQLAKSAKEQIHQP